MQASRLAALVEELIPRVDTAAADEVARKADVEAAEGALKKAAAVMDESSSTTSTVHATKVCQGTGLKTHASSDAASATAHTRGGANARVAGIPAAIAGLEAPRVGAAALWSAAGPP